mmetsp:Transcript_29919/g.64601  ORF Transcript_29919/g.64601 Transcript_29919/m.64601 type:complete len:183 (-) Transcript_29919:154-702(-)
MSNSDINGNLHNVEAWFVRQVIDHVLSLGKRPIVWQDVFDHFVFHPKPGVIHQTWISKFAFSEHLRKGYDGILSWGWYLNPGAGQGCSDWKGCYSIEPFRDPPGYEGNEKSMTSEDKARVIGGECALWEIPAADLHMALWPRGLAIAERLWSSADVVDVGEAQGRIEAFMAALNARLTMLRT